MPFKDKKYEKSYKHGYYLKNKAKILPNVKDYYRKNKTQILIKTKQYRLKSMDKIKAYSQKIKLKALQIVSYSEKPLCVNCGCADLRILEINHVNLNGSKELKTSKNGFKYKGRSSRSLFFEIINKNRPVSDLEVTCKVCNTKHYVEKKFGLKFKVEFLPEKEKGV
jgi:hypothetical protein